MKVASQVVGSGENKLRNRNKMFSGESEGKAALGTGQALYFYQENVQ